jgi:hypothetical protein
MPFQASGHFVAAVFQGFADRLRPFLGHWSAARPNRIVQLTGLPPMPEPQWIAFG